MSVVEQTKRRIERAQTLLDMNRPQEAEREARLALAGDPQNPDALVLLAVALVLLDRLDEAVEAASAALEGDPENARAHAALAAGLARAGRATEALDAMTRAVECAPWSPDFHVGQAHLLLDLGRPRDAVDAARRALTLDPQCADALKALAAAHVSFGDHHLAADAAAEALELEPEDAWSHGVAGAAALVRGDASTAADRYRDALRLDPTDLAYREGLAEALKARNPLYRGLFRLSRWQERQASIVQGLVTFYPLFAVVFLNVTGLRHTSGGSVAFVVVAVSVALLWAIEPVTNALFLLRPAGRLLLDAQRTRSALLFAACIGSAFAVAPLALVAEMPSMVLLTAAGLGVLALGLGTSHNLDEPSRCPMLYAVGAAAAACAVLSTAGALVGASFAGAAVLVLIAGIGSLWFVRLA